MQVNKSLKLLKKINSVFHSLMEDAESISKLEQELLKSYVIQFYDSIIEEENSAAPSEDFVKQHEKAHKIQETQEQRILAAAEVSEVGPTPARSEPGLAPTLAPASVVEDKPEPDSHPIAAEVANENEEYALDSLFKEVAELQNNSHIGERLITDLKKAMGLNDKLRYANELFGAKQSRLLDVLEKLNTTANFSSAKRILTPAAAEFEWLNADKHESVIGFLTLVHRKFNKS